MTSSHHLKIKAFLLVSFISSLLIVFCFSINFAEELENRTWDWRLAFVAPQAKPDPRIKLIMIDQTSLDSRAREEAQYWPWPRSLYNPVLLFLTKAKARAAAFDILFTEPSSYEEDDKEFFKTVGSSLPTVIAAALRTTHSQTDPATVKIFQEKQKALGYSAAARDRYLSLSSLGDFNFAALPLEGLAQSATAIANVSATPDSDGIFRHTTIGGYFRGIPILNLPFALLESVGSNEVLKSASQSVDEQGRLAVRFYGGANTYPYYSIDSIIQSWVRIEQDKEPFVPLKDFEDSIVFIGMNAPGLLDLRPTPLADIFPGVEFNATVLDNALHQTFFRKVGKVSSSLISIALVLLVTSVCFFVVKVSQQALLLPFVFITFTLGVGLAASWGWWIPFFIPMLAMITALLPALLMQYQFEGRQHRFIKDAFSYYVSSEVIDKIIQDPETLSLGGEHRELTIFFSDIAGFTAISENMEPEKLVQFLNRFLSEMTDIILASGGTVDKYQGDAIIAFWNAPLLVSDHRTRAVNTAMACQLKLQELTPYFEKEFGVAPHMRIGINTGVVTVGNFGSNTRFNYTMIGDAANLASRLEGVNKVFGSKILVSGATYASTSSDLFWRKVANIRVVGKNEIVQIYEPLLSDNELNKVFEDGRIYFDAGELEKAKACFLKLESDPISCAYLLRIDKEHGNPQESWDPVWNLTEK